jgi:protein-S-isoprenylcysteine O-methyltransferase Ste14
MTDTQSTETDNAGVLAPPPVIYAGTALAAVALHWIAPQPLPGEEFRLAVGPILAVLSVVLAVASIRRFRKAGTNVRPWEPTTTIVDTGPYRFTRNPMYLGLTGLYVGIGLIVGNLWFAVLFPPLIIVMQRGVILREEVYLARKFGEPYLSYKAKVRRWI